MEAVVPGQKEEGVNSNTADKATKETDNMESDKMEIKQEANKCAGKTRTAEETAVLTSTQPCRIFQAYGQTRGKEIKPGKMEDNKEKESDEEIK